MVRSGAWGCLTLALNFGIQPQPRNQSLGPVGPLRRHLDTDVGRWLVAVLPASQEGTAYTAHRCVCAWTLLRPLARAWPWRKEPALDTVRLFPCFLALGRTARIGEGAPGHQRSVPYVAVRCVSHRGTQW